MTPDTSSYMIAGSIVVLVGIIGYAASIIFRTINAQKKIDASMDPEKSPINKERF